MNVVASVVEWAQSRPLLAFSVAVPVALYLFDDVYVHSRRVAATKVPSLPARFSNLMTQADFEKARDYRMDKLSLNFWHNAYSIVVSVAKMVCGWLPFVWGVSGSLLHWFGYESVNDAPGLHAFLFFQLLGLCDHILALPWTIYNVFVLEARHGFNKQTPGFFVRDQLKSMALMSVLMLMFVPALTRIMLWAGDAFYFYAWLFILAFSVFGISIYPDFIAPLFDKYTDLAEGRLRSAIERLASRLDFPLTKLLVVEGSKRSAHSNAFFFGFFKNKRIVLFDTLIGPEAREEGAASVATEDSDKGCTVEQIVAVVAHELGHWYHSHVLKGFLLQQVVTFALLWASGLLIKNKQLYRDFGFDTEPMIVGVMLTSTFIFLPISTIVGFVVTIMTRMHEFQADRFAKALGYAEALKEGLIKLHKDNKAFPLEDPLHSKLHDTHPRLAQRLDALTKTE